MAASYNKFNSTSQDMLGGQFNLTSDTLKIALSNTAPSAAYHTYSDFSGIELAAGNGYVAGGMTVTGVSLTNVAGVTSVNSSPVTLTATTGAIGPFEYAVLYDATSAKLIGWWDYGSAVTLQAGDSETITPTGNVLFTEG